MNGAKVVFIIGDFTQFSSHNMMLQDVKWIIACNILINLLSKEYKYLSPYIATHIEYLYNIYNKKNK